jgi:CheY-like chemotaxis protein
LKILIAEDDAFFRRLLDKLLAADYEVSMVADGIAAWDALQLMEAPVLAILDWVMPGMMGPDICREARANPKTANTYLILLTARHSSADILAGLRSGADDYVTKPFKPDELLHGFTWGTELFSWNNLCWYRMRRSRAHAPARSSCKTGSPTSRPACRRPAPREIPAPHFSRLRTTPFPRKKTSAQTLRPTKAAQSITVKFRKDSVILLDRPLAARDAGWGGSFSSSLTVQYSQPNL